MNGRFYDITPKGMMLDVSVSPKKKKRYGYKLELMRNTEEHFHQ